MKAVVLSFYHPDLVKGGGQQVAVNLHRAFIKRGIDSLFVGVDNNVPRTLRSDATPIVKLSGRKNEYVCQVNGFNSLFMLTADPWSSRGLFSFVKSHAPDVIYVHHFLMLGLDLIYFLRLALPRTRFVFTAHEFLSLCMRDGHLIRVDGTLCKSHAPADCIKCFPEMPVTNFSVRNRIFDKFYGLFDKVVTPSHFMHENIASVFPLAKPKLVCIPNGSYFAPEIKKIMSSKQGSAPRKAIGFFGQLLADKGVYELLVAAEGVAELDGDVALDLWGGNFELNPEGFKEKFTRKLNEIRAKYPGVAINLKGEYKNGDAIELMRRYAVVVFPSKWPETFSLVLSEALLTGRTVVIPNIGAFKDRAKLYKDRVVTYEHGNAVAMRDAIAHALRRMTYPRTFPLTEDLTIETMAKSYLELA